MDEKRNESLLNHLRLKLQYEFPEIRATDLRVSQMKKRQLLVLEFKQVVMLPNKESQQNMERSLLTKLKDIFKGFSTYRQSFNPNGNIKIVLSKLISEWQA